MIEIRQGIFETNSSSVHELVIPKDCDLNIPTKVYLNPEKTERSKVSYEAKESVS